MGAQVLNVIHNGYIEGNDKKIPVSIIGLANRETFAADSLFCEWAYVIDLDKNTLEVYKGFNESPLPEGERFKYLENEKEKNSSYYPVKFIKSYPLNNLPSEDDFIKELDPRSRRRLKRP